MGYYTIDALHIQQYMFTIGKDELICKPNHVSEVSIAVADSRYLDTICNQAADNTEFVMRNKCLYYFHTNTKLEIHAVEYGKQNNCAIRLPSEDNKWLSQQPHQEGTFYLFRHRNADQQVGPSLGRGNESHYQWRGLLRNYVRDNVLWIAAIDFDAKSRKIQRLALSVNDADAVNKRYVQQSVQDLKNRVLELIRSVLQVMGIIPFIIGGFGNFLVPLILGSLDIAYPPEHEILSIILDYRKRTEKEELSVRQASKHCKAADPQHREIE
ncbi:hypothetical protein G5I_11585 [Acromyrmex echinatior]|uniref:Uncharacterized protein n=1 Tax=Acromyrmex echinatior TaxID=103372 RepID=F4X003_ACREC|nr:hypothetical protein G5I_11585 [Acromyrmex echinatior]